MAFCLQSTRRVHWQLAVLLSPAFHNGPSALAFSSQTHGFIFDQFRDGEAVMRLHKRQITELQSCFRKRPLPRLRTPFEFEDVSLRHRQAILNVLVSSDADAFLKFERVFTAREPDSGTTTRHQ